MEEGELLVVVQITWEEAWVTWEGVTWEEAAWEGLIWEEPTWEEVIWEALPWEVVIWEEEEDTEEEETAMLPHPYHQSPTLNPAMEQEEEEEEAATMGANTEMGELYNFKEV